MKDKLQTKYRGDWYLAGLMEFAAPGELIVNHSTGLIVLKMISKTQLNGEPINIDHRADRLKPNIILGKTDGFEKEITLYAPSTSTIFDHYIGSSYELTFHTEFVFLGVLFEKECDIQFKNINFKLSHLDAFFPYSAIIKTESAYKFDNSVFLPEFIYNNFQINIRGEHHVLKTGNEYKVDGKPFINIKSEINRSFKCFLDIVTDLKSFFYFALAEPVRILSCEIINEYRVRLQVYYTPWIQDTNLYSNKKYSSIWGSNNFLSNQIIGFIHKWFELNKLFIHPISLYQFATKDVWKSGNRNFEYNGLTNSLLNITQAIERIYKLDPVKIKAFLKMKDQKVQDFDNIKESIKKSNAQLSESQIIILNKRLKVIKSEKDINYIQLTQIIIEFCKEHKEALKGYIDENQFEKYATDLRKIRDDLSHANNFDDIENKFDEGEFSYMFNKTLLLFYVIIYRKLGFTDMEIQDVIINLKVL